MPVPIGLPLGVEALGSLVVLLKRFPDEELTLPSVVGPPVDSLPDGVGLPGNGLLPFDGLDGAPVFGEAPPVVALGCPLTARFALDAFFTF